jgi:hypothetical protein
MVQVYLRINKIWKRKHEQEVAESQSIVGLFLLMGNCVLWILYYVFVEEDPLSSLDTGFYLIESSVFALISTGFFVKTSKGSGFWALIRKALRAERKEADYLIKKFFRPNNAGIIIDILHQLAMIDEDLDPKEQELIEAFSKEWNIDYNVEELNKKRHDDSQSNYIRLRESVEFYLSADPPKEQAAQLKDMMKTMIEADDEVTEEEELISSELIGLVESYVKGGQGLDSFHVMIVPQNPEHHAAIKSLMPSAEQHKVAGGIAYSAGEYYSLKYAEMICDQYREERLFTIVHKPGAKPQDESSKSEK